MSSDSAIFIPARLASTRLPNKPLADINGTSMIVRVMKQAQKANIGDVYVACADEEIYNEILKNSGKAIMTNPDHPSGTDRIFEAYQKINKEYKYIINVQGDIPTIDTDSIIKAYNLIKQNNTDIATLAAKINCKEEAANPNIVKAIISFKNNNTNIGKALYFTRENAPYGDTSNKYHHIGLYAYKEDSLKRFIELPPSELEKQEKLEQLRALENGMNINIEVVDNAPFGIDTQEDLEKVRNIITD